MKPLFEYMNESVNAPATGIGAFPFCECGHCVVISNVVQQLTGYGYKATTGHVTNNQYKVTHNNSCLTIGVRPKMSGEGTRQPSCKIFIRLGHNGKLSIVEKYLNIDGDHKATYKVLSLDGDKFIWTPCKVDELPTTGDIEDTAEFASMFIKKIMTRNRRYIK
jgi:hypothetical protein